jgi:acetolactate synthase regulatory subunit
MNTAPLILIIGRHPSIMQRVLPLVSASGFEALAAISDEEADEKFSAHVQAIVFGGGVEAASVETLTDHFKKINPTILTKQHAGGPHAFEEMLTQLKQQLITKPKP